MTKEQAARRIYSQLWAKLEIDLRADHFDNYLNAGPHPDYRPLSNQERNMMHRTAQEIVRELAERASDPRIERTARVK